MTPPARPLRVLMTADTVGGVWSHALALCAALARWRVQVCLATMGALPSPDQRGEVKALPNVTLASLDAKLEWMPAPWDDVWRAGRWLRALAADWRPDVVHLNGYVHAAMDWSAPVMVVAHSCVLSWWRAVRGGDVPAEWEPYRRAVRRGLEAADVVVTPSRAMLEAVVSHYGRPRDAHVVHNGLPTSDSPRRVKDMFVLSAGRLWDEAKNVATLDAAAAHLSWPVYVAGERRQAGGCVPLFHARPLGWLSSAALRDWQARASIFALPARYEPFGLSALEAAQAGCALVLGDIPSQREVWRDSAVFVPPTSAGCLARAVQSLIDDPDRRALMAAQALRRAGMYSVERMARRYLALYVRLAARRPIFTAA